MTVEVTDEVLLASPARLGVNIGANAYYNDQQIVSRPLAHGGFPTGRQTGFLRVGESGVNSFRDERFQAGDASTAYRSSFTGGLYFIATGENAGASGRIAAHDVRTGVFTTENDGIARESGPGPRVEAGDYVWLRGPNVSHAVPDPMPGERELGIGDFRVEVAAGCDVSLATLDGDETEQAVRATVVSRDGYAAIKHYLIALPANEYRVVVRARAESGAGNLGVRLSNYGVPSGQPGHRIFMETDDASLTGDWNSYEFRGKTFDDQRIRDGFSAVDIRVSGGPATALIDRVELVDEGIDTGLAFSRGLVETLKEARCGVVRFYGVAGPGSDIGQLTRASASESVWTFTDGPGGFQRHTTHAVMKDWLRLSEEVGANPWITVSGANLPGGWHALISYLAAPSEYDEAAARRAAQGRDRPWTDAFDSVYLELGNEWWNGIFAPFVMSEPEDYGALCNTIFERVVTHPHYDPERIKLVVGGWAVNARDWNVRLDRASKHHDVISVAPYLAHALDRPEYAALFADVEGAFENGGRATLTGIGKTGLGVYELNTHTTGGGLSPADVSRMATSLGAGLAVLDQAMSCMAVWGAEPINYFTYFQRAYGNGDNTRLGLWGNLVLGRDGVHRPRPVWQGLRLANKYVIDGDLVAVRVGGAPTWNQRANGSVPALRGLPFLQAYAFRASAASVKVLLINRSLANPLRVRVDLPFETEPDVVQARLGGSSIDANNEEYERVVIDETVVQLRGPDSTIELPPHSATALQFRMAG